MLRRSWRTLSAPPNALQTVSQRLKAPGSVPLAVSSRGEKPGPPGRHAGRRRCRTRSDGDRAPRGRPTRARSYQAAALRRPEATKLPRADWGRPSFLAPGEPAQHPQLLRLGGAFFGRGSIRRAAGFSWMAASSALSATTSPEKGAFEPLPKLRIPDRAVLATEVLRSRRVGSANPEQREAREQGVHPQGARGSLPPQDHHRQHRDRSQRVYPLLPCPPGHRQGRSPKVSSPGGRRAALPRSGAPGHHAADR
jgi:hypothetical protein